MVQDTRRLRRQVWFLLLGRAVVGAALQVEKPGEIVCVNG